MMATHVSGQTYRRPRFSFIDALNYPLNLTAIYPHVSISCFLPQITRTFGDENRAWQVKLTGPAWCLQCAENMLISPMINFHLSHIPGSCLPNTD